MEGLFAGDKGLFGRDLSRWIGNRGGGDERFEFGGGVEGVVVWGFDWVEEFGEEERWL